MQENLKAFFLLRCTKTICRQDSWDFPGLASMASYWRSYWQKKKKNRRNLHAQEHNLRTETFYFLDVMTSVILYKSTKTQKWWDWSKGRTDLRYANGTMATTCGCMDSWGRTVSFTQKGAWSKASEYVQELKPKPQMLDSECLGSHWSETPPKAGIDVLMYSESFFCTM